MNTQLINAESYFWVNFKKSMYALLVIITVMAVPVLGYVGLSHKESNTTQLEALKSITALKANENTVKL